MKKSGIIKAEAKLVVKDFVEVMGGIEPGERIVSDPFMLGDTPLEIGFNGDLSTDLFLVENGGYPPHHGKQLFKKYPHHPPSRKFSVT